MQSELPVFTVYNCLISKWSLVDFFFGQNFWQTGGLKKKREAVRSPKSREVFNSPWENHMYAVWWPFCDIMHFEEKSSSSSKCIEACFILELYQIRRYILDIIKIFQIYTEEISVLFKH